MHSFEKKVLNAIKGHSLLEKGANVVAAVSGGPDSVALLVSLNEIADSLDLTILAAHVNHQLRGSESEEDERFVEDLCERLEIRLESRRIELEYSESSQNLEDSARRQRYDFLGEFAHRENAILATGHNRDDQAETFLMKLLRGAGPSGLSGIFMKREHRFHSDSVSVVRPLLEVTREEIIKYLKSKNQHFQEDSTNALLDCDRNWVRHQLLPTLRDRFNPGIAKTLARNASLFAEIERYLDHKAEELVDQIGSTAEESLLIDLREFVQSPPIMQKQVARSVIRCVKGDLLDITHKHILAFIDLCSGNSGRQIHLPGSLKVTREFDNLRISCAGNEVAPFDYAFELPGVLHLPGIGKKVVARKVAVSAKEGEILLSPTLKTLRVRNRRPGDRYLTSATSREKSLKRLFLERRVPISTRDRLVMLELEGKVVWIEGFAPNPAARASEVDLEGFEIEVVSETFGPSEPSK